MQAATITSPELVTELCDALTRLFGPDTAATISGRVLFPAGQAWLLNQIAKTPYPLRHLQTLANREHVSVWAEQFLRGTWDEADAVIRAIRAATR